MAKWRDMTDRLTGKAPAGARRSSKWSKVRDEFLKGKVCAVCGGKAKLVAHHRIPFSIAPDLELDETNLIPLCESGKYGICCHLLVGHVGAWSRLNPVVDADIAYWHQRLILDR